MNTQTDEGSRTAGPVDRIVGQPMPERANGCPFCGRSDLLGVEPHPEGGFLSVRCRACGCIGPARRSESDGEAWAAWSARKTPNTEVVRREASERTQS